MLSAFVWLGIGMGYIVGRVKERSVEHLLASQLDIMCVLSLLSIGNNEQSKIIG